MADPMTPLGVMRAVAYQRPAALGEPGFLEDVALPVPLVEGGDLLVQVEAIAVNPVDAKVRARELPPPGSWRVLGWEAVGRIRALGPSARGFGVGERVWYAGALQRQGSQAELQAVDHRLVAAAPASITPAEAAALPLTGLTAWELLFDRLRLVSDAAFGRGQTLLVVGAAGGVGSILVQLLRTLTGITVVATASRPEGRRWLLDLGAHAVVDHQRPLRPQLEALGVGAVDWAVSLSHTDQHFEALVDLLRPQGALALIDDPDPAAINVLALKRKSLALHWEFMFTRSLYDTPDLARQGEILRRLADLVDSGVLRSTLAIHGGPLSAASVSEALGRLSRGGAQGKIVLEGYQPG